MSILSETVPASFAGVPFLVMASSIGGGINNVVKQFPGSSRQLVENLGTKQRSYTIQAVVSSNASGDNYKQNRDNLLRVLESGDSGVLIHPMYGRIDNVKARTYTLSENFAELGVAGFTINFDVDDTNGTPVVSGDTISKVESSTDLALNAMAEYVTDAYMVSKSFPENFSASQHTIQSMITSFAVEATFLQVQADGINEFSALLVAMQRNITGLVTSPSNLVDSVVTLFDTIQGLYVSIDATFEVIVGFFNFGDDDATILPTTSGRVERLNNRSLLNSLMKVQALILNYSNASSIQYRTVDDVDRVADLLEGQYQKCIIDQDNGLGPEVIGAIQNLRTEVQKFFDAEKLNASQVVTITSREIPARVLAYQYYGTQDLGASIAELNRDLNVSFLKGNLEIFTS